MNSSKVAGAAKTVRDITTAMAKDKNYWASFAQVAGQGYQDAKADGASEWEANMFALANGIGNAAIEVGGGIQTLPVELRAGKRACAPGLPAPQRRARKRSFRASSRGRCKIWSMTGATRLYPFRMRTPC